MYDLIRSNKRRSRVILFNDRYGMDRVNFHERPGGFYFASEAKAILAVLPELRKWDVQSAGEFISTGAVMEGRTLFDGVRALPPASAWSLRKGSNPEKKQYFHAAEWEQQPRLDEATFYRRLREVFRERIPFYFSGSERVAMSLTGGLDTRMIMAWQRVPPKELPCYTFGSMFRENHDVRVARKVAEACGQPFEVITAGQDFLDRFPHYAERSVYLAEGCVDTSRSPDLYVNEQARQIALLPFTGGSLND